MKSRIAIIAQCERSLNGAWTNHPKPEDRATFYLGAAEAVKLCAEVANERGATCDVLREIKIIGDFMCDEAWKANVDYRAAQTATPSRPWWKALLLRLRYR